MVEWLFTMFCRAFSLPVVVNIWDLFLYYGEIVFFKMAICIFSFIENEITLLNYEECQILIRNSTKTLDTDKLLKIL